MHSHLLSRYMDTSLYSGVVIDRSCVTFPLWDLSGRMVGYQVYTPDKPKVRGNFIDPREMRYYTYASKYGSSQPALAAWGLETLKLSGTVFLCEGIFDACRLHRIGLSSLALLGSDPKHLRSWLRTLPHYLISVVQGDSAGCKLSKYGHSVIQLPDNEDVGSLSEANFNQIFKRYIE